MKSRRSRSSYDSYEEAEEKRDEDERQDEGKMMTRWMNGERQMGKMEKEELEATVIEAHTVRGGEERRRIENLWARGDIWTSR